MPLPVLQRHFRLSFFLNAGGGQIKKKILILKLYHCIYELYKLQRIFLSRRSIMCTSYLKKDIVFRMRGSNTYSMAKFLCAFEDISKCQIIRILRQKFWQQQQFMTATTLVVHTTCQYKKFYSIVLRRGGETQKTAPIFKTIYASH